MGDGAAKMPKVYGSGVTPFGVFLFAQTYRANADALALVFPQIRPSISDHPRRFLYFQALEHYLRSFLLLQGKTPANIRAYQHHFLDMLDEGRHLGLEMPSEVEDFIRSRTVANEYTQIRYDYKLDKDGPRRTARTMERLRLVVWEIEKAVGLAIRKTGIEAVYGERPSASPLNGSFAKA